MTFSKGGAETYEKQSPIADIAAWGTFKVWSDWPEETRGVRLEMRQGILETEEQGKQDQGFVKTLSWVDMFDDVWWRDVCAS